MKYVRCLALGANVLESLQRNEKMSNVTSVYTRTITLFLFENTNISNSYLQDGDLTGTRSKVQGSWDDTRFTSESRSFTSE